MTDNAHTKQVHDAADIIKTRLLDGGAIKPVMAIMLGSGLGGVCDDATDTASLPYTDIPGFPELGVAGHAGDILRGTLGGAPVLFLRGRKHMYETDDATPIKVMIRSLKLAGVDTLFLTNSAGSLRHDMAPGEIMVISDHINFMGINPLTGPNDDDFGPRFVALGDAWDGGLRSLFHAAGGEAGVKLHEGVYVAFRGPCFETAAEIRMAANWADAVGMSTVPECMIARHCGLRVAGASGITNLGEGMSDEQLSHDHTLENAAKVGANMRRILPIFVGMLHKQQKAA